MNQTLPVLAVAASMITTFLGNGILLGCLLGCVVLAWRHGFFFITLVGLGIFVSFVLALVGTGELARVLLEGDLPPRHVPVLAYGVILLGVLIGIGMAISQWVPDQAVWNGTIVGRLLGIGVGMVAGLVLAGSILVGWSMAAVPPGLVLQPQDLAFDAGSFALKVVSRFVEPDRDRRKAILGGWQRFRSDEPGVRPACSEPFVDADQNCVRDAHERYLDIDGDGTFTLVLPAAATGPAATGRWTPGMLDCYSMGSWLHVVAAHSPQLTSPAETAIDVSVLGAGLYQATAVDPDPCDRLTYAINESGAGAEEAALTINPETGRVDLTEAAVQEVRPLYEFTVTATDQSGLVAELPVRVRVRNLPSRPSR
jgi:hypothetical protein